VAVQQRLVVDWSGERRDRNWARSIMRVTLRIGSSASKPYASRESPGRSSMLTALRGISPRIHVELVTVRNGYEHHPAITVRAVQNIGAGLLLPTTFTVLIHAAGPARLSVAIAIEDNVFRVLHDGVETQYSRTHPC
jgi:hypothetical protein